MAVPLKNLPAWQGRTVAVLASGPSSTPRASQLLREAGVPVIATNTTGKLGCDILYGADVSWWTNRDNEWALSSEALLVTASVSVPFRKVHSVLVTGLYGFDPVVGNIRTGMNSGYQAIHLALQTKPARLLVLGVDLTIKHGVHWHGLHSNGMSNPSERFLERCRPWFSALREIADKQGTSVINCSQISKLDCFPISTLEKELASSSSSP